MSGLHSFEGAVKKNIYNRKDVAMTNGLGYVPDGLGILPAVVAAPAIAKVGLAATLKAGVLANIKAKVAEKVLAALGSAKTKIAAISGKKPPTPQTIDDLLAYGYAAALAGQPSTIHKPRKSGDKGRHPAFMSGYEAATADKNAIENAIKNAVALRRSPEDIAIAAANAVTAVPANKQQELTNYVMGRVQAYGGSIAAYLEAEAIEAEVAQTAALMEQAKLEAEARSRAEAAAQAKADAEAKARLEAERLARNNGVPTSGPGALPPTPTPTPNIPPVNVDRGTILPPDVSTQLPQTDVTSPMALRDAVADRPGPIPAALKPYVPYILGGLTLVIVGGMLLRPGATRPNPRRKK